MMSKVDIYMVLLPSVLSPADIPLHLGSYREGGGRSGRGHPWRLLALRAARRRRRSVAVIVGGWPPIVVVPLIGAVRPCLILRRQEILVPLMIDLHRPGAPHGVRVILIVVGVHGLRLPLPIVRMPIAVHVRRVVRDHHGVTQMDCGRNLRGAMARRQG